jgi:hypothetical protein
MKKTIPILTILILFSVSARSQLMVTKLVGKNADKVKLGFGAFLTYDFPLNEMGNRSIRLELLDFGYFGGKDVDVDPALAYLSIKAGYKYTFSESKTGFYLEPQAGYCRVVVAHPDEPEAAHRDGVALAIEGGYSLEVGERGNTFNFGLKYETDRAGSGFVISSVGFRVSYSFGMFKKSNNY